MGLSIIKCKIVEPIEADAAYLVDSYLKQRLKEIQPKGILCVKEETIGKNCINKLWHCIDDSIVENEDLTYEQSSLELSKIRVIFPNEIQEKLLKYIIKDEELGEYSWFNKEKLEEDFDFIYISW